MEKIGEQEAESGPTTTQLLHSWLRSGHLLVPLLLNIVVISLVVWTRRRFTLGSRPGVIRRAVVAWILTLLGGAALTVAGGLLMSHDFTPTRPGPPCWRPTCPTCCPSAPAAS